MDGTTLSSMAGVLLSLMFSYVPGLKQWYGALDGTRKRLVMLAALLVVAFGCWVLACAGYAADFGISLTCNRPGAVALVQAFLAALVANQATYLVTPRGEEG